MTEQTDASVGGWLPPLPDCSYPPGATPLPDSRPATLLGKVAGQPLVAEEMEVWPVQSNLAHVTYETDELQALCPVTGQPDIYHAVISYPAHSAGGTFESKGMKHYLWGFRDKGIGCEDLAARLADDLTRRLTVPVVVELRQQVRGGLTLTAIAKGRKLP